MFAYLKTLSPADRAQEIAAIEQVLQQDPTALVPLYRDAATQQVSRNIAQTMVVSITGIAIGAILAGAFMGFPLALTAGTLFLAQQFWNGQKQKQTARWAIEDGNDFTQYLDPGTQREYRQFAAAVKQTSGHVLPHSTAVIDVPVVAVEERTSKTTTDLPSNQSPNTTPNLTAAAIQQRLSVECPELLLLVKAPPIRLVGHQRTGKSTFARKLALLRAVLLPGHCVAWSTPHREADNLVPEALNPFGSSERGKDYPAIEAVWQATQAAIDKGQQLNTTIVWDEFGGYDQFHDLEALGTSLRSLLREATKHSYFPVVVAHGDQANFYPGVKGVLGTLKDSTVKVETIGKQLDAYGTMAPTGRVTVTWLDGRTSDIQLPDWLTVELLLTLQPANTRPALLDTIALNSLPLPAVPAMSTAANQPKGSEQFVGQADSDQKALEQKQRIQKKLAEKLKSSGAEWVNVRDLTTNLFSRSEDRDIAKSVLSTLIKTGRLERDQKENANKTRSLLVRVKTRH